MTTTPATQVKYSFIANGSAGYTIPQWIFQKNDISVWFDTAVQAEGSYSISLPQPTGYDLFLASPPNSPVVITVLRRIIIDDPESFSPDVAFTAQNVNVKFDANYLIDTDIEYYTKYAAPSYSDEEIVAGTLTQLDVDLPRLSTPGPGEAPRVWGKSSNGEILDFPLDPSGKSAAELEAELAAATNAQDSGSTMVAYWNTIPGGTNLGKINQQEAMDDVRRVLMPATSVTDSGAAQITYWDGTQSITLQEAIDNINAANLYTFTKYATDQLAYAGALADSDENHFHWSPLE